MRKALLATIGTLALVVGPAFSQAQNTEIDKHLTLSEDGFQTAPEDGKRYLMGVITNADESRTCDCWVHVNYFDADHLILRTKTVNTLNLKPATTWKFKIPAFDPKIDRYEIFRINAKWYGGSPPPKQG
jgi:hypothetical protein